VRELERNVWDYLDTTLEGSITVACITTTGYCKNGLAVLEHGTATQVAERYPDLARKLGTHIARYGVTTAQLYPGLVVFPVKEAEAIATARNVLPHKAGRYPPGTLAPAHALKASMKRIKQSLAELEAIRNACGWEAVGLTRPGCNATGGLEWEAVRPLCKPYGDWLHIVTYKPTPAAKVVAAVKPVPVTNAAPPGQVRVLICGDRAWANYGQVSHVVRLLKGAYGKDLVIVAGGCTGADTMAETAARQCFVACEVYPAEWKKYGRAAGPVRNRQMLDTGIYLVVAFHDDMANSKGTRDCFTEAQRRGIMTRHITSETALAPV